MPEQYRMSPLLHELVKEMFRMLITYEIELTAYNLVLNRAQENFIHHGIPWDMMSNVRKILKSPALAAEAEAEYAPFDALLRELTPQNLEIALASIRRRVAHHEASIPPEVE
jgi:3-deoxy-D-manno-octulosonic-acid transferase